MKNELQDVQLGPKLIKIPTDWEHLKLNNVARINPKYDKKENGKFDFVPMDAVDEAQKTINYFNRRELKNCTGTWFKNGDTIYAKITPCAENGKIAFVENVQTEVPTYRTLSF